MRKAMAERNATSAIYLSKTAAGLAVEVGEWADGTTDAGPFVAPTSLERAKTINRKVTDVRASANEIQTGTESLRDEVRASLTVVEDALSATAPAEKKTLVPVAG
jgi:hypothetical protein